MNKIFIKNYTNMKMNKILIKNYTNMKKSILLMLMVTYCVSIFATNYFVESGAPESATWNENPIVTEGTVVNLSTAESTLNEWFNAQTFTASDEIWIAAGTYVLSGTIAYTRTASNPYSIYGGFAGTETSLAGRAKGTEPWNFTNETVLDGGETYQILLNVSELSGKGYYEGADGRIWIIDGLTFTNGTAANGGGFSSTDGAITIRNCKLTGNTSTVSGGGIYVNGGQHVIIDGCLFDSNTATSSGGGAYVTGDRARVSDCLFEENRTTNSGGGGGGALFFNGGAINANTVPGNPGLYYSKITNSIFRKNASAFLGGAIFDDRGILENCIIVNNAGLRSGSKEKNTIEIKTGSMINCTVANNTGGVRLDYNGTFSFVNTILWNNTNPFEGGNGQKITHFTHCATDVDIAALLPVSWNNEGSSITSTVVFTTENLPYFVTPTTFTGLPADEDQTVELLASNWQLATGSPCVDAGSDRSADPDTDSAYDIFGVRRPQMSAFDIGACELPCSDKPAVLLSSDVESICYGGDVNLSLTLTGTAPWKVIYTENGEEKTIEAIDESPYILSVTPEITTTYTITGIYTDGCESENLSESLTITVNPVYTTPVSEKICEGSSYDFFGTILSEAGTYQHTLTSVSGCDSTIVLTLNINPVYTTPVSEEICEGSSYDFFGTILSETGTYQHTLTSVSGCDSTIVLTLNINPVYTTPVSEEICEGSSYDFFGTILSEAGTYQHTLTSVSGCDSTIVLSLTLKDCSVGLDFVAADVKIYPNPVSEQLHIEIASSFVTEIVLYDLTGNKIRETPFISEKGSFGTVNLVGVSPGVYLLHIKANDKILIRKIIKN
jgi:hypothetical protein